MIPKKRLILGWLLESVWYFFVLFTSPFIFFWSKRFQQGHREQTVLILCDTFATPLTYFRMAARLHRKGFSVWTLSMGTIFSSLNEQARRLGIFLEEQKLQNVILIGHGSGGLVALKLSDAPRQRIHHLIPVGTPFNGTRLLLPFTFIKALRDMAVGSEFLLLNRTNAMLYPEFTPFTAWQDQTITPFVLSRFGQGRDLILDQVGHMNLVLEKDNIDTIVEIIDEGYPDASLAMEQSQVAMEQMASMMNSKKATPPIKLAAVPVPRSKSKSTKKKTSSKITKKPVVKKKTTRSRVTKKAR